MMRFRKVVWCFPAWRDAHLSGVGGRGADGVAAGHRRLGCLHLPSPPMGTPAQGTAAPVFARFDGSVPLPASSSLAHMHSAARG